GSSSSAQSQAGSSVSSRPISSGGAPAGAGPREPTDVRIELLLPDRGGTAPQRSQDRDDPARRQSSQVPKGDDRAGACRRALQPAGASVRRGDRQGRGEDARRAV